MKELTARQQIYKLSTLCDVFDPISDAGFINWFCKRSELKDRAKKLYKKIKTIRTSKLINLDESRIILQNNPFLFSLKTFDDFQFIDGDGKIIYTVIPKINGFSEVWGRENNFDKAIVKGSWTDVKNFFLK